MKRKNEVRKVRKVKVGVFRDALNFYHGLRKKKNSDPDWKKFYWIDFVKLFGQFIGENQLLEKVYYFTAPPPNLDQLTRQRLLFKANSLINGSRFEVVDGKFFPKNVTCKICGNPYRIYEEKHTDVNIAIQMLDDCLLGKVDAIVLVSADGDLLTPLKLIKQRFTDIKIRVYFPPGNKSDALYNFMKTCKKQVVELGKNKVKFQQCIMPDTVTNDDKSHTIPDQWK